MLFKLVVMFLLIILICDVETIIKKIEKNETEKEKIGETIEE